MRIGWTLLAPAWLCVGSWAHASPVENVLEDRYEADEIDGTDLEMSSTSRPIVIGTHRSGVFLSLSAFRDRQPEGRISWGGGVLFSMPLERLAPSVPTRAPKSLVQDGAHAPLSGGSAGSTTAPSTLDPKAAPEPGPLGLVTLRRARECARAALRTAGYEDHEASVDRLAHRARLSAALPEMRLRAVRTTDQSLRLTPTDIDPARYTESGAAGYTFEGRLTFRLDRLLFADEEVSLERLRTERSEARARVQAKAIALFFQWERAHLEELDPTLNSAEHQVAFLAELEAGAALDALTDGWFSRELRDPGHWPKGP